MTAEIVEFVGLPGSGKTTLTRLLKQELNSRGVNAACPPNLRAWWMEELPTALFARPRPLSLSHTALMVSNVVEFAIGAAWDGHPIDGHRLIKALARVPWAIATPAMIDAEVLLFDECLLQALWGIVVTASGSDAISDQSLSNTNLLGIYRHFRPHIVYFESDVEVSLQRLQQRAVYETRFERWSTDVARRALTHGAAKLDELIAKAQRECHLPVTMVSVHDSPEKSAEYLLESSLFGSPLQ